MKITIIGPENIYEQEVSPSMEVQDLIALIAAEVSHLSLLPPLTRHGPQTPIEHY